MSTIKTMFDTNNKKEKEKEKQINTQENKLSDVK